MSTHKSHVNCSIYVDDIFALKIVCFEGSRFGSAMMGSCQWCQLGYISNPNPRYYRTLVSFQPLLWPNKSVYLPNLISNWGNLKSPATQPGPWYLSLSLYSVPLCLFQSHSLNHLPFLCWPASLQPKIRFWKPAAILSRCSLVQICVHSKRGGATMWPTCLWPCWSFWVGQPLSLPLAAVSVPWGHRGWSVKPHDRRLWVNSGRSWAQRCRLRFAVSWSEGPLWWAWMWLNPSSTNPLGWLGRVGTLVSH